MPEGSVMLSLIMKRFLQTHWLIILTNPVNQIRNLFRKSTYPVIPTGRTVIVLLGLIIGLFIGLFRII
jgi:hypothetical protein